MPEEMIKRQIAHKVPIALLNTGTYVKEEGWTPNYISDANGRKISRVNIIAAVVEKEAAGRPANLILDDASGRIAVRFFDVTDSFQHIEIGDIVQIIGRPREFGAEKYILPEIMKKISDAKWLAVRKAEFELQSLPLPSVALEKGAEAPVEEIQIGDEKPQENLAVRVYNLIKQSDKGNGADMEDLILAIGNSRAEDVIRMLLEEGEIFEIKPGRLKVLE